jgi:hypothetical protein
MNRRAHLDAHLGPSRGGEGLVLSVRTRVKGAQRVQGLL